MPLTRGLSERETEASGGNWSTRRIALSRFIGGRDPEGLKLSVRLRKALDPLDKKVLRFMKINAADTTGSDELRPFVGKDPIPPGRALYPRGLSKLRSKICRCTPGTKSRESYNQHSVLLRDEKKMAVCHITAFGGTSENQRPKIASGASWQRWAVCEVPEFAADAMLNDDYYASDRRGSILKEPTFDALATYETSLE